MANLRNKTIERLSHENCQVLEKIISRLPCTASYEMEIWIWGLTYKPVEMATSLKFKEVAVQDCIVIRGELANQYRALNPEWEYGKAEPEDDTTKKLWTGLQGDKYAFYVVMQKIKEFSYFEGGKIAKVHYCLKSEKKEKQFGGLREMGFSYDEATFLLENAKRIGEVFSKLVKQKLDRYERELSQEEKKVNKNLPAKVEKTVENKPSKEVKVMSPQELVERRTDIESFFKSYDFVCSFEKKEWLLENRKKIESFFKAYSSLES